jgi:3-oxoadipate enol-lactonase
VSAPALHYADSGGAAEAVLLAHAIGCEHRMWEGVLPALSPRFRTVAIDARGHGRSPRTPRPWSLEDMADDVARVLDDLRLERVHWVGLSMGGMVGQAFALRHGRRLGRLVLANTTSSYGQAGRELWDARIRLVQQGGLAAIRELTIARYFSPAFRTSHADIVERTMARFMETSAEAYIGCCEAIRELDYADAIRGLRAPTLVIAGELDVGTPLAMSQVIASRVPDARLEVLTGAAHLSAVEQPQAFGALVRRFLAPGEASQ